MKLNRAQFGRTLERFALAAFVASFIAPPNGFAQPMAITGPPSIDEVLREDAALSSVFFVERALGWAVGDRGVILHTRDSGQTWQQQNSPVACTLNAVFFLDAARGWAVGGSHKPLSTNSSGIVLRTIDGGVHWSVLATGQPELPLLQGVKFFDARKGVAFGATGPSSSAGVYVTNDGGQSWQPLASAKSGHWLTGDFLAPDIGALAGPRGRFATIANTQVVDSPLAIGSLRSMRSMRLTGPTEGWAVGDGGLVGKTTDLGRSWQSPPGELPPEVVDLFDFRGLAVQGPRVWFAGTPGSYVFHTPDNGETWQAFATRQSTPLKSLAFVDAEHGWAVGDLGVILATKDGGRTWQTQRSGGRRAALAAVFSQPDDVPLELVAREGAAEGYLTTVHFPLAAPLTEDANIHSGSLDATNELRAREAMLLAGATNAETEWRFPRPPADFAINEAELLTALNRSNDGHAIERIVARLVRQIRLWRPTVIVTHRGPSAKNSAVGTIVQQAALQAVAEAADEKRHTELAEIGLGAWQVKRVYGMLPPDQRGTERVLTGEFAPPLGASLVDWSTPARRLLSTRHRLPPDALEFELLTYAEGGGPVADENGLAPRRGLFSGLALAAGGEARRLHAAPPANVDELRLRATRQRGVQELLERGRGSEALAAQALTLTEGMDSASGGESIFQLAEGYRAAGQLDLAADAYYLLARNYREHPLAEPALRWLVQFYASGEMGARMNAKASATNVAGAAARAVSPATPTAAPAANVGSADTAVVKTSAEAPLGSESPPSIGLSPEERRRRAVELGKYLEAGRPALFAEPAVRFPIVAAERQLGFSNPAKRYFLSLAALPETDPWRISASTEQWLSEPHETPPSKSLGHCRPASARPHLDGTLNEPFWQTAEALRIGNPRSGDSHAEVRIAYDRQFLYIAARSPKIEGVAYDRDDRPRPRDADLAEHDRLAIRLDVDRDYTTCFELVVDSRGWTYDACWGDNTWNPSWFVAATQDDGTWVVEAAIPLFELAERSPQSRDVWALGIRRTIPRTGYQSWAGLADDADSPNQFGLLIFD